MSVSPPWTAVLTSAEHSLMLFGLVTTGLALTATLVRARFTSTESYGVYRTASLTANAVVAIAAATYLALVAAFLLGYREDGERWVPTATAQLAWAFRYMDWCVTVPLLVVELLAVSSVDERTVARARPIGIGLAIVMVVSGYLGAFVIADGLGAACFAGLYALVFGAFVRSAPRMPAPARLPYRSAIMLLLIVWLVYPIVYGLQGVTSGGAWAVAGTLALCVADAVAKIGFGGLIHRTAVLWTRTEEEVDPTKGRPRSPQAEAV